VEDDYHRLTDVSDTAVAVGVDVVTVEGADAVDIVDAVLSRWLDRTRSITRLTSVDDDEEVDEVLVSAIA
jgi:tRNA U34 5-carboxymethylaminomethyl modifying GTPase MnmE/TrmE